MHGHGPGDPRCREGRLTMLEDDRAMTGMQIRKGYELGASDHPAARSSQAQRAACAERKAAADAREVARMRKCRMMIGGMR